MIRSLRRRFVAASMLSLLAVLTLILGGLNIFHYKSVVSDVDSVLSLLKDSGGALPDAPEQLDWRQAGARFQSPELPYEIRFFTALLDGEGNVLETGTENIFALDGESVAACAREALQQGGDAGFVGDYRFLRYGEDGDTRLIFLDCGRMLAGFRDVLLSSALIALAGYAAVFLLVALLSGRIVRPFERLYARQRRFITDASHELRTPLTVIDADAELLQMEAGSSGWLDDIRAQTRRLATLAGELTALSRLEEGRELPKIEFPLSDVVREEAACFEAPARRLGKALDVCVEEGLSLCGDEGAIRRLVSVLMDNAVKYADPGGTVALRLCAHGRFVRLRVENAAGGLRREEVSDLFERFYRADAARASSGGFGVGLSIARAAVEAHRGRIRASLRGHTLSITADLPR